MPRNTTSTRNTSPSTRKSSPGRAKKSVSKGKTTSSASKMTLKERVAHIHTILKGEILRFVIGIFLLITGIFMLMSFTSHFFSGKLEQSEMEAGQLLHPHNIGGVLGAYTAHYFMGQCFGICAYFIPVFLVAWAVKLMRAYKVRLWKWFLNCAILMLWGSTLLCLIEDLVLGDGMLFGGVTFHAGGLHGIEVYQMLRTLVGVPGTCIIVITTAILYFTYLSSETMHVVRGMLKPQDLIKDRLNRRSHKDDLSDDETDETTDDPEQTARQANGSENEEDDDETEYEDRSTYSVSLSTEVGDDASTTLTIDTSPDTDTPKENLPLTIAPQDNLEQAEQTEANPVETPLDMEPYDPRKDLENYKFPQLDLLKKYADNSPAIDMAEQNTNKDRIISVLKSFGVEISSISARIGPTITLYEITPAEGVRISKIRNLEDDIALSLSALGIRIIAPIPGKGTIGIEVPNKNPRIVSMESIINSKKFQESTFDLPIALGKTITNEVYIADLAQIPHLLVAGATGQGKSVGLNAIITSLLYKKHPSELKFVMVDPKKVEFSIYSPLENHFLAKIPGEDDPIITDVTKVVQTLKSLCQLMDHRYDLLKRAHVRNIKEYNAKFKSRQLNPENGHEFMPYIVVIIDEFGDLIMTAGKEVELPIARIAQLARAVGMHMVIATQRPTTNIITGTIKANFPGRMAFKVMSQIDSRTILDRNGANQLVGRGDMLFLGKTNEPIRVQCAFVDTPEVEQINQFISTQQAYLSAYELPEPLMDSESNGGIGGGGLDASDVDPMFLEAARLIVVHQLGSTSLIQRKFSIGYNRAGRLMDQMERAGIVGPSRGAKPREVLCADESELEAKYNSLL